MSIKSAPATTPIAHLVLLSRALDLPKAIWRQPHTRRTLDPYPLQPHLPHLPPTSSLIEIELSPDTQSITQQQTHPLKPIVYAGVFRLTLTPASLKVRLDSQACARRLYSPTRPTIHLANLSPWQPLRVLLNGRADWSSGRFYYLRDYLLLFCQGPQPADLPPPQLIDLQADLF